MMPTMGDLAPPHNLDTTKEGQVRVADSIRVSLISPLLGVPALAVPVGCHRRLRPGVQILAPRFREDLCLDAGEVIEAAEGGCHADRSCAVSPAEARMKTGASIPGI